ncbi:amino acid ABC transporter substrate-binding protein [Paraoerskovia sediminicola]|uniref:Amino acid ABC transporter substrate-binding protein n=1 Tax=Paraoerskovia sediminicola TaxID=1138587 RepID=A0ABM8G2B3_9CELL|nr:ABC transporter substrate-binding protein [Paraoerskovia sediminicola]BDZ42247.1 amino acid ABC transporter substrate-binding protein [Paraoerskovia sediminicola]
MNRRTTFATRGLAIAAALSLGLAACSTSTDEGSDDSADGGDTSSSSETDDQLVVGTLLPLTGTLAFLGPPEVAGVGLAVQEINEAGGVLGNDATIVSADSGDTTDLNVSTQSATDLINQDADVMIGAASSSVSLNVVDMVTAAGVMQISPANTSNTLSGYSDLFARTAPPDTVQGAALGTLMLDGGATKVGLLVQNEDYGTGLRDNVQQTLESGGAEVVYGGSDSGQEFQPGESNFSAQVTDLLAQDPDAIGVIAFDETKAIVTELVAQGWEMGAKTFFCDGNTASYEEDFEPGTLEGVLGTIPGANAEGEFKERLDTYSVDEEGEELTSYAYGPESYDATILAALAAVRGGSADGQTIADNIKQVSGSEGGTEVSTFAEGVEALEAGDEINYKPVSGGGPLNEDNDPSSALIGVYEYDGNNVQQFTRAVEGKI